MSDFKMFLFKVVYIVFLTCFTFLCANVGSQRDTSSNSDVCRSVSTVTIDLKQVYDRKGLYVTAVPDEPFFRLLDNLCVTAFPLDDYQQLYTFYSNVVLIDGTEIPTYTLAEDVPPGTFRRANPDGTISQRFFSNFGDFTLACTQFEFGENPSPPLFAVSFSPRSKNTEQEIEQMEDIFRARGFQNVSLYALPMKLPPRCVLSQPCETTNASTCTVQKPYQAKIARLLGLC